MGDLEFQILTSVRKHEKEGELRSMKLVNDGSTSFSILRVRGSPGSPSLWEHSFGSFGGLGFNGGGGAVTGGSL